MTFPMNLFCTRPTQDTWRLCFFVSFIFHKSENKKKYTVRYLPGENNNFTIVKPKEDDKRTLVRNFVSIKIFFRLLSFEDCILGSNLGSRRGSNLGSILGSAATVDGIGLEKISKKEKNRCSFQVRCTCHWCMVWTTSFAWIKCSITMVAFRVGLFARSFLHNQLPSLKGRSRRALQKFWISLIDNVSREDTKRRRHATWET